jgi:2-polyprenyl-3-methyl-5-hydroxy-6-metoxy-1,4-benzoquinol methylase
LASKKTDQQQYWDSKILAWERSAYSRDLKGQSFIERVATFFRGPIRARREVLVSTLQARLKGATVLELGCASGPLAAPILKAGAKQYTGVDISPQAIALAQRTASTLGIAEKARFMQANVSERNDLPEADVVFGLGFLDYLSASDQQRLFKSLKGEFIFSFPEKRQSLLNFLQVFYLRTQGCPGFFKFSQAEMADIIPKNAGHFFIERQGLVFVTNIREFLPGPKVSAAENPR